MPGSFPASLFSDELLALVRPFRTYERLGLAPAPHGTAGWLGRLVLLLFMLGVFVSFTASGRLVLQHVLCTMVFWSFLPAWQVAALVLSLRLWARPSSYRPALSMLWVGNGAFYLLLLLVSAVCLFVPNVYRAITWLLRSGILPALFASALVSGAVHTFALVRAGLGVPRGRAFAVTGTYYLVLSLGIGSYYFVTNQIQPQLFGVPQ